MTETIIRIYEYLRAHHTVRLLSFVAITLLLVLSVSRLGYKEDIADFLPVDNKHHNAMKVFQNISGADKIFAVFAYRDTTKADPDAMVACIDAFVDEVEKTDTAGMVGGLMSQVDMEKMTRLTDFVYGNIPYFLTDADYSRIDSVLAQPGYVAQQLRQDKQMLMFPTGGLLSDNIQRDPLNLFTPVVQKLQGMGSALNYELYDGHIFSPDMQKGIVMMRSPYGASETERNSQLVAMLEACADSVMLGCGNIDIHVVGGPVIAVTNAAQIKADSILSVAVSVTLILALLLFSFRNVRNLLLIAFSIAWGWLFAMGGLALFHDKVSVIVIGISSVILGIAVNYPLHFIAHLSHTPNKKKALREIVMPLLVGNVTTVGAFLALVPLKSVALRDLGLFSSLLLVGTILFVLVYLPHLSRETKEVKHTFLDRLSGVSLENKPIFVAVIVMLTVVFGYFSLQTRFDANMGHINYMTDEQKADMEYFQRTMVQGGNMQSVYAVSSDSTIDGALDKSLRLMPHLAELKAGGSVHGYSSCSRFVVSKKEQQRRLYLWKKFVSRHGEALASGLAAAMRSEGFAAGSFYDFNSLLNNTYIPQPFEYFKPLVSAMFAQNIFCDNEARQYSVINVLSVENAKVHAVEGALEKVGCYSFDAVSMNSAIADHLSNDFNYIGFACGFIVFFFLWVSMGCIELATLSFVPMAVSWLWILGIMAIFGMQFNIVNIILATFIFGQGDDYTIFMTEGASYEYAYRRKMLASYKHSIIISALIMFIGIGTLIVARHPALHSLAEVTIAGMFSVVLMAYVFPPLIFKFLVCRKGGGYRRRPVSLVPLLSRGLAAASLSLALLSMLGVGFCLLKLMKPTPKHRQVFRNYVCWTISFALRHLPRVSFKIDDEGGGCLQSAALLMGQFRSAYDVMAFMCMSPRIMFVFSGTMHFGFLLNTILRWCGSTAFSADAAADKGLLKEAVAKGLGVAYLFDEASGLEACKRIAAMAERCALDVVPVVAYGADNAFCSECLCLYSGAMGVALQQRIVLKDIPSDSCRYDAASALHECYAKASAFVAHRIFTADYFAPLVIDRYRYKGAELFADVKRNLRKNANYAAVIDSAVNVGTAVVVGDSWGEFALLYALVHGGTRVVVAEPNADRRDILRYSAEGIADNLEICSSLSDALHSVGNDSVKLYALDGTVDAGERNESHVKTL